MNKRKKLEVALEIITEGDQAKIPSSLRRRLFGNDWAPKMRAHQAREEKWIGTRAVQGLAVGNKTKCGRRTRELAIVVFVDKKKPMRKVRKPVPSELIIPGLGTFKTDVGPMGRLVCQEFADRVRPAMPGCSIGHTRMQTYGTLGLVVRKKQATRGSPVYILSNAHVLALDGLASVGDNIVQPGPDDAHGPKSPIAKLAEWVPFDFTQRGWPNRVDAAIARVIRANDVTRSIRLVDVVPTKTSTKIVEGMRVLKVGRTSDDADGKVLFASAKVKLLYAKTKRSSGIVRFGDQVICTPYSSPGDSGSVILNSRKEVIGLHTSGSASASIFNKIEHVFALLDLKLA